MKPKTFMLIAGEASGDLLAAELVFALRAKLPDAKFFGAGGPKMATAGVALAFDLTQHSVIGVSDVLKNLLKFRRLFKQLLALAIERKPDVIIGVDYGGFNLRLGHAIKEHVRSNPFARWNPKLIQFVSPQVWASRPGRAQLLAEDYDLLLSIFPFEKDWYAKRVPKLRVEYVGHPMIGRYPKADGGSRKAGETAKILLLPGSRKSELQRHLSPMLHAAQMLSAENIVQFKMVLPHENLSKLLAGRLAELLPKLETPILLNWRDPSQWLMNAQALAAIALPNLEIQIGNLPQALAEADVAISKTGTVTMECALFGVPAVTLYKTSWLTYQIARRVVTVKSLTMPNLLAGEEVYPEFIQNAATPVNLARAAKALLQNGVRRAKTKFQLGKIIVSLGKPGAAERAALAILSLR